MPPAAELVRLRLVCLVVCAQDHVFDRTHLRYLTWSPLVLYVRLYWDEMANIQAQQGLTLF